MGHIALPAPLDGDCLDEERSTFLARRRAVQAAESLDRVFTLALLDEVDEAALVKAYARGCAALHDVLAFVSRQHLEAARGGAR